MKLTRSFRNSARFSLFYLSLVGGGLARATLTRDTEADISGTQDGSGTLSGAAMIGNGGALAPGAVGKENFGSTLAFSSGSIFEWNLGTEATSGRGTNHDAADVTGALTGGGAIFNIVLGGGLAFSDTFWAVHRTWTDIFTHGGSSTLLRSVFAPLSGDSLEWRAVPEWSNALAGCLLGAGLLRRRRSLAVCG